MSVTIMEKQTTPDRQAQLRLPVPTQVAASSAFGENESHCAIGQYFSNSV
jgi:hypothetical protein